MENYKYSKVYPFEVEDDVSPDSEEGQAIIDFIHEHERYTAEHPRFPHPRAQELFDKTVAECELILQEFSGRIEAKVDYSCYEATIDLWCVYADFDRGEFLEILHNITHVAMGIHFQPLTSGDLHIKIYMPYFIRGAEEE